MWILPNNHPLYSAFALECVDSKEVLTEHVKDLVGSPKLPQLMWRSKVSSHTTWLSRWSKVYWLQHLFTRTLKPLIGKYFETRLTGYLADIHANLSLSLENETELKTHGTCGHTSQKELIQLDLWGASLKTSATILTSDMKMSGESYKKWVILLGKESIQRKKLARLTREIVYLSSQSGTTNWQTPKVSTGDYSYNQGDHNKVTLNLSGQVKKWGTPRNPTNNGQGYAKNSDKERLEDQVMQWPTPTVAEAGKIPNQANYGQKALSNHPAIVGLPNRAKTKKGDSTGGRHDPDKINLNGKAPVLNPAWVSHLMDTHLEKIFCDYSEMVWWNRQRKLLLSACYESKEFWIQIKNYEGLYEVSIYGRIRSMHRIVKRREGTTRVVPERILSKIISNRGYVLVTLCKNGEKERLRVHRIVASHFILNEKNYDEVNHIDGNKFNNYAPNLEWCTRSENIQHAYDIGLVK